MRQKQRVFSLFLLSPSSRRAWIEIAYDDGYTAGRAESPSSRRAWIEIAYDDGYTAGRADGRPPHGGRG